MPRLPERLPGALSERIASLSGSVYSRQGLEVDVAIGGIPFRLATFGDAPYTIETIPVRRDQLDTENDPGEQSLTSWWRRSQSSFHEGAGFRYAEGGDNTPNNGFWDSEGVDVFTEGEVRLLHRMEQGTATNVFSRIKTCTIGGVIGLSAIVDGGLWGNVGAGTTWSSLYSPSGETLVDGLVAGTNYYAVSDADDLYTAGTVGIHVWPLGATPSRITWGKARLWVIGGPNIWQPDLTDADGTLQNPVFTHPNPGWTYTAIAEGPQAMYFAGHDGMHSAIQAVSLDSSGGLPALSGAAVTATLPDGELVQEIAVIAGTLVGIGTNRGFRVGVISSDTPAITYGPLLIEPEGLTRCTAMTVQGRFFLVAFQTPSGGSQVYRVDTGTPIADGVYPYAKDVKCATGTHVTSLAAPASYRSTSAVPEVVASTSDGKWHYQSTTTFGSGWLESGRIRYRTTEKKAYKYLGLGIEPLAGIIAVDLVLENGSFLPLGSVTEQGQVFDDAFAIQADAQRSASVRLTFTANGTGTGSPVVNSYLLRALPAVAPQRMHTLSLLCYDREQARSGQVYGGEGYARDRLTALRLLEDTAETLVFQDFSSATSQGTLTVIEGMRFTQTSPAPPFKSEGAGGVLTIQLRTVS